MKKAFQLPGFEIEHEDDDLCDDDDWMYELESYISKRGSCSAHTLQLVVKDGFKAIIIM